MKENFGDFVVREIPFNALLITSGLPASYKTETAEVIAELRGFPILRTDLIRLEVLKGEDIFDEKVAANMQKRESVYEEMFKRADDIIMKGRGLILDATFVKCSLRIKAAEIAVKHRKTFIIQQTQCPEEVSLRRIAKRTKDNYESNALTPQAYYNNKDKFEEINLDSLKQRFPKLKIMHFIVDTTSDESDKWYVIFKDTR